MNWRGVKTSRLFVWANSSRIPKSIFCGIVRALAKEGFRARKPNFAGLGEDAESIKAISLWSSEARATPPVVASNEARSRRDRSYKLASLPDAGFRRVVSGGVARFARSTTGYAAAMPPACNFGIRVELPYCLGVKYQKENPWRMTPRAFDQGRVTNSLYGAVTLRRIMRRGWLASCGTVSPIFTV